MEAKDLKFTLEQGFTYLRFLLTKPQNRFVNLGDIKLKKMFDIVYLDLINPNLSFQ